MPEMPEVKQCDLCGALIERYERTFETHSFEVSNITLEDGRNTLCNACKATIARVVAEATAHAIEMLSNKGRTLKN